MDSRSMSRINWLIGSTGSLSLSLHCTSYKRVEWDWRIAWESRLSENASRHQRNFRLPYTPCLTRFMDARECVQAWEKVFQCNREEQITVGDDDHGWLLPLHRMGFHLLQFVDTSVRKLRGLQLQTLKELETRIQPQNYGTDFSESVDTACLPASYESG
ncbi:hypothetical protein BofuT4_P107960.1 [Botrytis cinerea T4]|uniref:Uncharacterized protein n=1 Tax=Botryotinia fuckeliana (strain T4) TaxID=999810 RepID=G2Y710_BOTF4|nr:hypothetical protein BofuT4_P107960.1 [Botrytis cinerea T4]